MVEVACTQVTPAYERPWLSGQMSNWSEKDGAVSPGTAVLSVGVGAGFGTLGCQAGGLGSSASLSTDNDDERLKLCNEMGQHFHPEHVPRL